MKHSILMLLLLPFLLGCCQQKKTTSPDQTVATSNTSEASPAQAPVSYDPETPNAELQPVEEDLSGKVISLTAREFMEKIVEVDPGNGYRYRGNTPCVVDFYANWCRPCMSFKPIFHKLAEQYKGKIIFYQIDVDKAQEVCAIFNVQSIPTFVFFSKKAQPLKMVGAPTEQEMKAALDDFLAQ
ncbi:MAG: thioredoxin family protein [Bacteroidales bacterium]|nr:thioredoxin family protein [Bacteroidales bacterium]